MVGLILLYFVGKAFYDLAGRHNKGQWLFAILGVGSYYAGLFIGAMIIGIVYELFIGSVDDVNDTVLGVMALPIGVLSCWGLYRILKSRWGKVETFSATSDEVLDANFIDQNSEKL
jgi:amino acid permease